jgi:hypothetical protein
VLIRARARVMWCGWPEQARGADNSDDDSSDDDEAPASAARAPEGWAAFQARASGRECERDRVRADGWMGAWGGGCERCITLIHER